MANVRGCNLPDELLYDVENHIWYQELADGNVKLGMTAVATAMAGQLVAYTPKKVGRGVDAGKSCATVESGKWVGPAKSAVAAGNNPFADQYERCIRSTSFMDLLLCGRVPDRCLSDVGR